MKLRIKSNNLRFRITGEELLQLQSTGSIASETYIPTRGNESILMRNEIVVQPEGLTSELKLTEFGFSCRLSRQDMATLVDPENEGVYIKRVGRTPSGEATGFVFYVEKDKKKKDKKHKHKDHKHLGHAEPGAESNGAQINPAVEDRL